MPRTTLYPRYRNEKNLEGISYVAEPRLRPAREQPGLDQEQERLGASGRSAAGLADGLPTLPVVTRFISGWTAF